MNEKINKIKEYYLLIGYLYGIVMLSLALLFVLFLIKIGWLTI